MNNTTAIKEATKSDYQKYMVDGVSYLVYKQQMAADLALNPDQQIQSYIHLNQSRMARVEKTYMPSETIVQQVMNLKHQVNWLILTEHWCGDAAQTLPVFNAIAALSNGKIALRLVYRDKNEPLMNQYLTEGSKSIPKLVQLDSNFNVTGIWGPRPSEAQKLVKTLKANPETSATYANALHLWYAKDKQLSLEKEISQLLVRANLFCVDCFS